MKKILVIGSYNVGLSVIGDKIPVVGETVMGREFEMGPGGKGSNQAIALNRLNADSKFMCCVGDDHFGEDALSLFKQEGMALDFIRMLPGSHTGVGVILIDKDGYNAIGVAPGANYKLTEQYLIENIHLFEVSDYLLIQLEIQLDVVKAAIRLASQNNLTVVFNPAPAQKIDSETLQLTDYITPNETEAQIMSGVTVTDKESANEAAQVLIAEGAKNVIITLGDKGCLLVNSKKQQFFPAFKVNTIDSTGAGDAFNGGFVFALGRGDTVEDAIVFASKVAALSVTKMGTVSGLPTLQQVLQFKP